MWMLSLAKNFIVLYVQCAYTEWNDSYPGLPGWSGTVSDFITFLRMMLNWQLWIVNFGTHLLNVFGLWLSTGYWTCRKRNRGLGRTTACYLRTVKFFIYCSLGTNQGYELIKEKIISYYSKSVKTLSSE